MASFRSLIVNAGWNLLGNVLPLLAGVVAVPFLVTHLGTERFGLLSLAWVLIGYFGLFDFGVGRALTRMVAERWSGVPNAQIDSLASTGVAFGAAAGLAGGLLVAAVAGVDEGWFSHWSPELIQESRGALVLIGIGVLPTVLVAVLRGILEGFQRFRLLTAIRVPAGMLLFLAPCASAWFSPRLEIAVATLVATRWLMLLLHGIACRPSVRLSRAAVDPAWITPLFRFGGWLTVSNIVGPVIVYLDRFVIGALLLPNQLAYYAAPFEMVSRLLVLPSSLTGALFPVLAQSQGFDVEAGRALRRRAMRWVAALVLPAALIGVLAAAPLLRGWLGDAFAVNGTRATQILLVGFAFNALAQIPMVALHGIGLARATATLHLVELPFYAVLLYALVRAHGLEGAALAWSARGALDLLALTLMLRQAERRAPPASLVEG